MSKREDHQVELGSVGEELPITQRLERSRIMYIEDKSKGIEGPGRIGRVYFSKSGRTLYYKDKKFQRLSGTGFKANYFDVETGIHYWISGPRKDRSDRLYGGSLGVEVDPDVQDEYMEYVAT